MPDEHKVNELKISREGRLHCTGMNPGDHAEVWKDAALTCEVDSYFHRDRYNPKIAFHLMIHSKALKHVADAYEAAQKKWEEPVNGNHTH